MQQMIRNRIDHAAGNLGAGGIVEKDERSSRLERREPLPDVVDRKRHYFGSVNATYSPE
jgi:hypothetical protein